MSQTEAQSVRSVRPGTHRLKKWQFQKGNPGKKKGTKDKRTVLGQEAARSLEEGAWHVIERLLGSSSWRARHEAAKTVLGYAIGLPRATLELSGGFGDLARELSAALIEARERRLALIPSQGVSVDNVLDVRALPEGDSSLCLERATEPSEGTILAGMAEAAPEGDRATNANVGEASGKVDE
jgi:hypothetical protein